MMHNMVVGDDSNDVDLTFSASIDEPSSLHQVPRDWRSRLQSFLTLKRAIKCLLFFLYFLVGCIFYHHYEGWSVYKTISFSIVTMCTVGYGYRHPTSDESRLFTIFYLIIGVYIVYFYIAKEITKRFANALASSQILTEPDTVGKEYSYHRRMLAINILLLAMTVFFGALIIHGIETDWTFIESLYFAVETTSTVGYGDLTITNENTHLFLGFYILFSTVLSAFAFNNFQLLQAEKKNIEKFKKKLEKQGDLTFLCALDNGNGLTQPEFVLALLEHLGTIDYKKDVKPLIEKFNELNPDRNGKVFRKTLETFSIQESATAKKAQEVLQSYKEMPIFKSPPNSGLVLRKVRNKEKTTELASLVDSKDVDDSKLGFSTAPSS